MTIKPRSERPGARRLATASADQVTAGASETEHGLSQA